MDMYREHPSDFEPSGASESQDSGGAAIGTDERRMHVRAYNYWASLLDGRDYPSIEDLEPGDLLDFAPHSVLLDFTSGGDEPATPYIGAAIRAECDLPDEVQSIAQVPSRSLLSRLTDHYMQIIANRAPVGFEAEFENQRDETICYRGILMPFSSDGDTIDFIYGVINWKKADEESQVAKAPAPVLKPVLDPIAEEEEPLELIVPLEAEAEVEAGPEPELDIELDDDAGLADRLWAARECVEALKVSEGRSRDSLYRALSRAYDFALVSRAEPQEYAELLEESGVKAQVRAPMTPIVKLVFGIDCDKARLTEYAAALAYADRQGIELGGFLAFIEAQAGGLKALIAAERQARKPEPKADTKTEKARERLRTARSVALDAIDSEEEFALVLTRRSNSGVHEAIALVEDPALVERAIRQVGG
ncbi:MAG: PAS domain-containing protein [Sphingomicrobium sp.]